MDIHPLVDEHWPEFAALVRQLDALDGRTISVTAQRNQPPALSPDDTAEAIKRYNRRNGVT